MTNKLEENKDVQRAVTMLMTAPRLREQRLLAQRQMAAVMASAGHRAELGIRSTGQGDPVSGAFEHREKLQKEIDILDTLIARAEERADRLIRCVPSLRVRKLLEMRYLSGLKWEVVAECMDIGVRTAMRSHQRGLKYIENLLREEEDARKS